jgi:hypothetical protein
MQITFSMFLEKIVAIELFLAHDNYDILIELKRKCIIF